MTCSHQWNWQMYLFMSLQNARDRTCKVSMTESHGAVKARTKSQKIYSVTTSGVYERHHPNVFELNSSVMLNGQEILLNIAQVFKVYLHFHQKLFMFNGHVQ